ncbi:hypothetical protein Tco_1091275 [Tanacetum coccineum]|uniref:Uncharacterized protein n=1 Tax=Tanacetum coccineum TaxID=301880 RepID=A0ABQ5I8G7_9ASTR
MLTKPQVFYDDTHKQALGYQNPFYLKKAQWIKPTLYDGSAISKKNDVISVVDEEETLILEEESRSQMLAKQNDPISKENKVNISSINYSKLNKLAKDFGKHFVPQKEFVCMNKHLFYKFQTLTLNNLDVPPNTLLKEVLKTSQISTDTPYLLDGYIVLVFRIQSSKSSSISAPESAFCYVSPITP